MGKKNFFILRIYNDEQLLKLKNKEISNLKKNLNTVPKIYKTKLIKLSNQNPNLSRRTCFITHQEIKEVIKKIEEMNFEEYLKLIKKDENENEEMKKMKMKKMKMKHMMNQFKIF